MLRKQAVIVGKFFINHERSIVREVLQISRLTVIFKTYHLDTRNSCDSPSECTVQDFVRWARAEASPTEMAFLQYQDMQA